ncbi:MAG TPA: 3-hydroxyacyl-ACP dehydratase FabZ, partial [Pyrinomonadaceae bacterium]
METLLDALAIQKLLPHRYPFLLVDRIVELVPRERIVGIKQVSINEWFFQGHFPGAPVMPGVLVVEALAQVGAVLALREIEDRDQKLVLFTGIKEARFRRPV